MVATQVGRASPTGTVGSESPAKSVWAGGSVGALVLAAGSASRMGGRPKCLLQLNGEALICRQISALLEAGVCEVVVVLGHYGHEIARCVAAHFPEFLQTPEFELSPIFSQFARGPYTGSVRLVWNPRPDDGQIASQRIGLAALSPRHDAVVVALADQALICAQDIRDVMAAYGARPAQRQVVVPTEQGLPGNPVMFSQDVCAAILQGDADMGCKQWQRANPQQVYRWETANTHYRWDVDTPGDIERLAAESGHRLVWPNGVSAPVPASSPLATVGQ
jgi:molybdenum cofactor cytidylyltransferase